ncbi:MAG: hypothetical protein ABIK28_10245 [Planctomycetota bacterium]
MESSYWSSEVIFETRGLIGGCAIGDMDAAVPGNEIVAVCRSGEIHMIYRSESDWKSKLIFSSPGEMIQCTIGDVDPDLPGRELVAVGIASGYEESGGLGAAYLVYRDRDAWKGEKIFDDESLLHGVCIGDGGVFVTGYSRKAHLLKKNGRQWIAEKVADLPGAGKAAVQTPKGVLFASTDGSLIRVNRSESGWSSEVVDKRDSGRARLGAQDDRIIVSDDDGTLSIVGTVRREEIYSERSELRGAVLCDLDPSCPGMEAATAGYQKKVTVLYRQNNAWNPRTLYYDTGMFHHLVAGDLDGLPGMELAACGYSGRLVILRCCSEHRQ